MTVLAKVGEDTGFLALLLEALESTLEVLIVVDDDFRQAVCPSFRGENGAPIGCGEGVTLRCSEYSVKRGILAPWIRRAAAGRPNYEFRE